METERERESERTKRQKYIYRNEKIEKKREKVIKREREKK